MANGSSRFRALVMLCLFLLGRALSFLIFPYARSRARPIQDHKQSETTNGGRARYRFFQPLQPSAMRQERLYLCHLSHRQNKTTSPLHGPKPFNWASPPHALPCLKGLPNTFKAWKSGVLMRTDDRERLSVQCLLYFK